MEATIGIAIFIVVIWFFFYKCDHKFEERHKTFDEFPNVTNFHYQCVYCGADKIVSLDGNEIKKEEE